MLSSKAGSVGRSKTIGISVMAVLLLTLVLAGPPSANAAGIRQLCVYVDSPSTPFSAGHAFVQLISNNVPGSRNQVYGFYPMTANIFGGPGVIQNDAARHWDWKICYDLTLAQYNTLVAFITAAIAAPAAYDLFSFNCVDWAASVAAAVGITLPAFANLLGISDPLAFQTTLSTAGNGAVIGGGTVHNNPGNVPPTASGDPPPICCSDVADSQDGVSDPTDTASNLQVTYVPTTEPTQTLGLGDVLQVNVVGGNPSTSIIYVDWGDGSTSAQSTSMTHTYTTTGTFTAYLLVINSITLERETIPVNVVSSSTSAQVVNVQAPSDSGTPAVYGLNTPTEPVPETTSLSVPEFGFSPLLLAAVAFALLALLFVSRKRLRWADAPAQPSGSV